MFKSFQREFSARSEIRMSKGKKNTRSRGQVDPVLDAGSGTSEQPSEEDVNNHKKLLDLTTDKLTKLGKSKPLLN